ncbi:nuclear transport factor 2 family protein [Nocardia sp. NRRL S-836]|uniref:nuclear transport factor 2 family protein n=1 Tax=Nocardia sp. NRRL S-836 TaxID=1519492 RepID=UPI0006AEAFD4|nr:nuclear transport factor 2 family protein [Nocardia sp. NRRL S-836]KOV79772.1 hypothetical protein ADL03_36080 [Nocardia sp. NRRL S-836]
MNDPTTTTALDRYLELADRLVADPAALAELGTVFAAGAVVRLHDRDVVGIEALTEFYRTFAATFEETKHFWNTEVLADGTLRARWAVAGRRTGGAVMAASGTEHATVDACGLITALRNEFEPTGTERSG